MKMIYVTGPPGVGKTEFGDRATTLGYPACFVDEERLTTPTNVLTGEAVTEIGNTNEWHDTHVFKLDPRKVHEAAKQALERADADKRDVVYVCGTVTDDAEHWRMFDEHVSIVTKRPTAAQRMKDREDPRNTFGREQEERDRATSRMDNKILLHYELGAIMINGEQSKEAVFADILSVTQP